MKGVNEWKNKINKDSKCVYPTKSPNKKPKCVSNDSTQTKATYTS